MSANEETTKVLTQAIKQLDDGVAVSHRWSHNLGHAAGDAGYAVAEEKLHAAQAALADVRGLIDEALADIETHAE